MDGFIDANGELKTTEYTAGEKGENSRRIWKRIKKLQLKLSERKSQVAAEEPQVVEIV